MAVQHKKYQEAVPHQMLSHGEQFRDLVLEIQYEVGSIGRQPYGKQVKLLQAVLDKMKARLRAELVTKDAHHFEQLFMDFWRAVQHHGGTELYFQSAVFFADYLELLGKYQEQFVFCFEQDADARVSLAEGHLCHILLQERLGIAYFYLGEVEQAGEFLEASWFDFCRCSKQNLQIRRHLLKYRALVYLAQGNSKMALKLCSSLELCVKKAYEDSGIYKMDALSVKAMCLLQRERADRGLAKFFGSYGAYGAGFLEGHPCRLHIANVMMGYELMKLKQTISRKGSDSPVDGEWSSGKMLKENGAEKLKMMMAAFGQWHIEVFWAYKQIAELSMLSGEPEKAAYYYERCFAGFEGVLGGNHPLLLEMMAEMVKCYEQMGEEEQAERFDREYKRRSSQSVNLQIEDLVCQAKENVQEMWDIRKQQTLIRQEEEKRQQEEAKRQQERLQQEIRQKAVSAYEMRVQKQNDQERKRKKQLLEFQKKEG